MTSLWQQCPSLALALLLLSGSLFALYPLYGLALAVAIFLSLPRREWLKGALLIALSTAYTLHVQHQKQPPPDGEYSRLLVHVQDIRRIATPFMQTSLLFATLDSYADTNASHKAKIPVVIPLSQRAPPKSRLLFFERARLSVNKSGSAMIKARTWEELPSHYPSLAFARFTLKQKICRYIAKAYKTELPRLFLQTVATNFSSSLALNELFRQTGLSHLLAVSGFHFTVIAGGFFLLFYGRLPKTPFCIVNIAFITAFYLYMGGSDSVFRAYEMMLLALIALLLERKPVPLNIFGATLCFALFIDPLSIRTAGFQLSFTVTFGLLTLYPYTKQLARRYFPPYPVDYARSLSKMQQIRYVLSRNILDIMLVTLSASIASFFPLLMHFQSFEIGALIYNLYFPIALSLALSLFLIALIIPPLHTVNNALLSLALIPIEYPPRCTTYALYLPIPPLILFLAEIALFAALLRHQTHSSTFLFQPSAAAQPNPL